MTLTLRHKSGKTERLDWPTQPATFRLPVRLPDGGWSSINFEHLYEGEYQEVMNFKTARNAPWDGLEQQSKEIDQRGA